jgi:hypothetical protein
VHQELEELKTRRSLGQVLSAVEERRLHTFTSAGEKRRLQTFTTSNGTGAGSLQLLAQQPWKSALTYVSSVPACAAAIDGAFGGFVYISTDDSDDDGHCAPDAARATHAGLTGHALDMQAKAPHAATCTKTSSPRRGMPAPSHPATQ